MSPILRARLGGGEAFDWFYGSDAEPGVDQIRTPIVGWRLRQALDVSGEGPGRLVVERPRGAGRRRARGPRPEWAPGGKPIWLTEVGIPAVDKGANSPNVFPDPQILGGRLAVLLDG